MCESNKLFFNTLKKKNDFSTTEDKESDNSMNVIFKVLCSQENDTVRPKTFTHLGRNISFDKTCGQVLDSTFDELCDRVSSFFVQSCF